MKKKLFFILLTALLAVLFAGCSIFGISDNASKEPLPLSNGTTAGNILNYGFCVKHGDDLIWLYTAGDYYPLGSTLRSSPDEESSELLMEDGGLYMNLVGTMLYYCKPEGIFKADIEEPVPQLVLEKDVKQLQIKDGVMYYIEDGTLDARTMDGEEAGFEPVEGADCLNVYADRLYFIGTQDGYIYSCSLDGGDIRTEFAHEVSMFIVMDDIIYYLDGITGYLVKIELGGKLATAVVEQPLTGFNINRSNMYYTRYISGIGTCCNADIDGRNEETITEFGDSQWHVTCMYNTGTLLARVEDMENRDFRASLPLCS